jgi:type I restriction enzyme S subunit
VTSDALPVGWVWATLADLLAEPLINGRSVRTQEGGFPVLRLTAIKDGIVDCTEAKPGAWDAAAAEPYLVCPGDLLIVRGNGSLDLVGRAGLVPYGVPAVAFPDTAIRARVHSAMVDPRWLTHVWSSPLVREQIRKAARTTAGIYKVNQTTLGAVRLPVPPINEQRRVVTALDEQLPRLDTTVAAMRIVRQRLLQLQDAALTLLLDGSGSARRPLGDLLREPLRNGLSARASADPDGVRIFTLTAVTRRDFSHHHTKVTSADPDKARGLWCEPGDIFIQRSNTPELVGSAAMFTGDRDFAIFPDLLIRVRVTAALDPAYLELVLRAPATRRYFRERAQGLAGSMPKISQGTITALPVPTPPLDVQRALTSRARDQIDQAAHAAASLQELEKRSAALRRSLLQAALTGRLTRREPTDEPADLLLKRIAEERAVSAPTARRRMRTFPVAAGDAHNTHVEESA